MNEELGLFMTKLADEIYRRYQVCTGTVTPDSILLSICNAIHEVLKESSGPP